MKQIDWLIIKKYLKFHSQQKEDLQSIGFTQRPLLNIFRMCDRWNFLIILKTSLFQTHIELISYCE